MNPLSNSTQPNPQRSSQPRRRRPFRGPVRSGGDRRPDRGGDRPSDQRSDRRPPDTRPQSPSPRAPARFGDRRPFDRARPPRDGQRPFDPSRRAPAQRPFDTNRRGTGPRPPFSEQRTGDPRPPRDTQRAGAPNPRRPFGQRPTRDTRGQQKPDTRTPQQKKAARDFRHGPGAKPKPILRRPPAARDLRLVGDESTGLVPDRGPSTTATPTPITLKRDTLRVYGLGGLEEVGRNCTVFEYNDSIIIVDLGLQFPEEDMPGIDYIIPNIDALRSRTKNIKAIIITHGHLDHTGAISHLIEDLGNPPVYTLPLTVGMIKRRHEEFSKRKMNLQAIQRDTKIRLGDFQVEFFGVSHNIPDAVAVALTTPVGTVIHTGDFKLDETELGSNSTEFHRIKEIGQRGVLALISDSTNAMKPGRQMSEEQITNVLDGIIRDAKGRVIVGTFGSLVSRLGQMITIAEKYGKKVVIEGYSMRMNLEIAKELGYMKFRKDTFILAQQADDYAPNKVLILCTGAQGEDNAALMRIANREHRFLRIQKGDTVIFSSSVIPGNERSVQRVTDGLYMEGAEVINYQMMDVHAGGHAQQEDLKDLIRMLTPQYLIPVHGNFSFRKNHETVAIQAGVEPKNIFVPLNGQIVEFDKNGGRMTKDRVNTDYVFVDGLGVGDVSHVVLRDRQQMAADGMVVVIATVSRQGKVIGMPDVITRGFVHVKNNFKLIDDIRLQTKQLLAQHGTKGPANDAFLRDKIRDELGQFLFQKTERRPMILPVIIEV